MNKILFKEISIKHICKPTLKNTYISVSRNAEVILKTPKVSQSFIFNLLQEKENWIRKQLLKAERNPPKTVNLEDEILLFGEIYSIDIDEAQKLRELLQRIRVNTKENIIKCYDKFYKEFARIHLIPRVEYYSALMGLNYKDIKFKKMRSRWGSCSTDKIITFNTELIKVQKELIDYVVVHELAHLVHMNHSKSFHSLVDDYLPSSQALRKELKNISISNDK